MKQKQEMPECPKLTIFDESFDFKSITDLQNAQEDLHKTRNELERLLFGMVCAGLGFDMLKDEDGIEDIKYKFDDLINEYKTTINDLAICAVYEDEYNYGDGSLKKYWDDCQAIRKAEDEAHARFIRNTKILGLSLNLFDAYKIYNHLEEKHPEVLDEYIKNNHKLTKEEKDLMLAEIKAEEDAALAKLKEQLENE